MGPLWTIVELESPTAKATNNREGKHHQLLTPDLGLPPLQNHLFATTKFMEMSATWKQFYRSTQRAFPKLNSNMVFNFPEEAEQTNQG